MLRALGLASLFVVNAAAQMNFPPPPNPPGNPWNGSKVLLGMALFFEEQLSSTGTVACATCHDFAHGGVDPRTFDSRNPGPDGVFATADDQHGSPGVTRILSNGAAQANAVHGFGPQVTTRRAPTVINSGYHTALTYDGSKANLEQLIPGPMFNAVEMSHEGRTAAQLAQRITDVRPLVLATELPPRLQTFVTGRTYPQMFQLAFGTSTITQQLIVNAIACYLRSLNSDGSKWDRVLHGIESLTPEEQLGLTLFNTPANGATSCRTCHSDFEQRVLLEGPMVGQMTMTFTGPYGSSFPTRLLFHNVGVRPIAEDPGRQQFTGAPVDAGKFRVASLRNVELTAPYFHNGSMQTLDDVVEFYNHGGDFHVNQAAMLTPRNYSIADKNAIVALLRTLTDPRIVAGQIPFDRPTLASQSQLRLPLPLGTSAITQAGRPLVANAPFSARIGESWFRLTLGGATPGSFSFLMWDVTAGGGPFEHLGVLLTVTPAFQLIVAGQATASGTPSAGVAQLQIPIPNNPALSGQFGLAQWLVLEPTPTLPFATSNALLIPLL